MATALLQLGIDDQAVLTRLAGAATDLQLREALSSALAAAKDAMASAAGPSAHGSTGAALGAARCADSGDESEEAEEAPPPLAE